MSAAARPFARQRHIKKPFAACTVLIGRRASAYRDAHAFDPHRRAFQPIEIAAAIFLYC
jgi:hypothetical protein